jgi:CubicO group peptidase (beta-lactamase class C family)
MRVLKIALAALVVVVLWTALVIVGTREGWWRAMPAPRGDAAAFVAAAKARYASESKGNIALALIVHGRIADEYFASPGKPVDRNTLFQVASMSKWLTAWGVMALVEKGRIDLDAPVSRYLTRWKLPPGAFDNSGVTVRRLLSHTAGLTDGLGFRGFAPGETPPTIEAELTHAADSQPGSSGVVRVGLRPGSTWRYSGGGYLLLQLLIEEVSHRPFNDYMREAVLRPLGMMNSTYVAPDPAHLAEFYDTDGKPGVRYSFTALSAASLYTSTADMTHFLQAQVTGPQGEPPGRGVLKPQTLELMRRPQAFVFGIPIWGLGNILYTDNNAGGFIVGHDGNNYPAINTTARLDPATGDGIVVLETGNAGLASEIGRDWVFWHTGHVGIDTIAVEAQHTLAILAGGLLVIAFAAGVIAWRRRRRRIFVRKYGDG